MIDIKYERVLWQRYINEADADALVELFEKNNSRLHAIAMQVTGNAADAEDAVQQSIEQLLNRKPTSNVESVQPWLIGVVLNQARMIVRRETRIHKRQKQKEMDVQQQSMDPSAYVEQQETVSLIQNIISELPQHYREPLVLHHIEGMNFSTIADALGRKEETVKKQSQRGIAMMRKLMHKRGISVAMVLLVSVLQRLGASEHDAFMYSEIATPIELPPWWTTMNPALPTAAAALILMPFFFMSDATPEQDPVESPAIMAMQEPVEEAVVEVAEPEKPVEEEKVEKKPWNKAKIKQVYTCPFGELEKMEDSQIEKLEPVAAEQAILDNEYWIFKPKGKNPTMFETKRLKLPNEFHMQFEFKHHELEMFKDQKFSIYLGFLFNRSRKKHKSETIQSPNKEFAASILGAKDKWHTVDIEVSIPDAKKPQMREVTYSINGQVHWQVRTNVRSADIIPIGVINTAVVMRRFQYLDLNAIN